MLNTVAIAGRLTHDPQVQTTPGGVAYVRFRVAVERDYAQEGNRPVDWVPCVAWRQTATFLGKYFRKGSAILVSGRLESNAWEKDGERHSEMVLRAEQVYFGESLKARNARECDIPDYPPMDDDTPLPFMEG